MTGPGEARRFIVVPGRFNQKNAGITAGPEDPSVTAVRARIGSLYLNYETGAIFHKIGTGNTDWEELGAADGGVDVENQGAAVPGGPFTTLNFTGAGVVAADAGGGKADVTISGGGGGGGLLYYTTVVGNALEGDTAPDVNFLDPGDGSGIAAAIAALPASGGTILIRKGIYTLAANLAIDRDNVRLIGEGAGSTIIIGTAGGAFNFLLELGSSTTPRSDIEIAGITFTENAAATFGTGGIIGDRVSNVYIHDCEFFSRTDASFPPNGWVATGFADTAGPDIDAENIRIENNRFDGESGLAVVNGTALVGVIGFNKVVNGQIVKNTCVVSNTGSTIIVAIATNIVISDNMFAGTITQGSGGVVGTVDSNNITITGNVADMAASPTVFNILSSTEVTIVGNASTITSGTHISIGSPSTTTISNNALSGGTVGIKLISSDNVVIGNTIIGTTIGIDIDSSRDRNLINGNHLRSNTTAISVAGDDCIITNNQGSGNTTDVSDTGARNYWSNNWFQLPSAQTTDGTATVIFGFTIPDTTVWIFNVMVAARETDGSNRAAYERTVRAHREGGGAVLGNVQNDFTDETDNLWAATFTFSGNDVQVIVSGVADTTIDWSANVSWRGT